MERSKMLEQLHEITGIVCNLVITYDMGIQFDVLTSEGVCTNIGDIGNWPCFEMLVSEDLIKLRNKAIEMRDDITVEDVLSVDTCRRLLTYYDQASGDNWVVEGEILGKCISNLIDSIRGIDISLEKVFAFVDLEVWSDGTVRFFNNKNEFDAFFVAKYGSAPYRYEEMSDEELKCFFDTAIENNVGVPFDCLIPSSH